MAVERTFSIIKPDATRRNLTGKINARFEEKGLRIVAQKRIWMSRQQAEEFYGVHKARPFFNDLCTFMTSGPVVVQVLEGENADRQEPRDHGRHQPGQRRGGHHPQGFRRVDRGQLGARLRIRPRMRRSRSPTSSPAPRSSAEPLAFALKQFPSSRPRAAGPSGATVLFRRCEVAIESHL